MTDDPDLALRQDVRLLGDLLGKTIAQQTHADALGLIESLRSLSKAVRENEEDALEKLKTTLAGLADEEMLTVARAFGLFLNCANLAEQYHRVRRTRWHQRQEQSLQPGSLSAFFNDYFEANNDKADLEALLSEVQIDLVLTAHPTEVMRRTLMQKYDCISENLERLDNPLLTPKQRSRYTRHIGREITAIWHTHEIRRRRPTPDDEIKWGLAVVENNLWPAVSRYMREFSRLTAAYCGQPLPLTARPIRFSSWMGGDRDGNPNVTAEVTARACLMARWMAADMYYQAISELRGELSMNEANDALKAVVGDVDEPYRAYLQPLKQRLLCTKAVMEAALDNSIITHDDVIEDVEDILAPLRLCYASLHDIGAGCVADGRLLDTIRRITCFGLTLTTLDVRQEASHHSALIGTVLRQSRGVDYEAMPEEERLQCLLALLEDSQAIDTRTIQWPAAQQDDWALFEVLAAQHPDSFGAYVISMCKTGSDILAVMVLQRLAGIEKPLRVVPLFETKQDLMNAPSLMQNLWSVPAYVEACNYAQEVMIGYSDSAKDAGIFAAAWAQYQAQEALVEIAAQHHIKLTLFHGRGGTVGRGGGPAHVAVLSQPPGSVQGRLRVTQQGEVIRNRFGLESLARRTMELYTTATLKATLQPPPAPKPEWRRQMAMLSEAAHVAYRQLLDDPRFVPWFQKITPVKELSALAISSRPSKRHTQGGLESLRAIPWIFAWTQNRWIMPAWYGVGHALAWATDKHLMDSVEEMRTGWPFFKSLLSLVEMSLAKVDKHVAHHYCNSLATAEESDLCVALNTSFSQTVESLKECLKADTLLLQNPVLKRAIDVRNPYILPINLLQVELLKRIRSGHDKSVLHDALMITIAGVAAGMRNTG